MKSMLLGMLGLMAVSACANPRVQGAQDARSLLIGMDKETLLACAGVPELSETTGNAEFFTYEVKQSYAGPRYGLGLGLGHGYGHHRGFGFHSSLFLPFDYEERTVGCKATFALKDNRVTGLTYGGLSDGSARLDQCYTVVENCLNPQLATQ